MNKETINKRDIRGIDGSVKKIYFSSDHHYSHDNIIKYCNRPYKSSREMDYKLIDNWNKTVNPEDTVYYLGDFSMRYWAAEKYAPLLNGNKILVCGNHDDCHPYKKKHTEFVQKYYDLGFLEVVTEMKLKLSLLGKECVVKLHHMPYALEFARDKYAAYRPVKEDESLLLCGHVHDAWRKYKGCINVGVDVWDFKPISISDIEYAMKQPDCFPKHNRGD